jgi:hypothetical protein
MLLQAEREGRATIPVMAGGALIDINVSELLNGVAGEAGSVASWNGASSISVTAGPIDANDSKMSQQNGLSRRLLLAARKVLSFPALVGRFTLDLLGRHESAESSTKIMGWVILIFIGLLFGGYVHFDALVLVFTNVWRFFFPA